MKHFMNLILSLMLAIGPATPHYAFANPVRDIASLTDRAADPENGFEVVDLGTEDNHVYVLIVDLKEKETVEKTFKGIASDVEDAIRAFPELRSVIVTVHPRDLTETEEDESLGESITHMFWDFDSHKTVAKEMNIAEHRMHSFREMLLPRNMPPAESKTRNIIDFVNERNAENPDSASFMRMLFEKDINEINIERPNWDKTTSLIRGAATAAGVVIGVNTIADPDVMETAAISTLPTIAAIWAGLKNKALAAWEEGKPIEARKKSSKMNSYLRQAAGILKNVGLAAGFVATFYLPMSYFGYAPSLLDTAAFASTAGMALGNNVFKKTFMVRALTRWKHKKYQQNPRHAAKYARFHAWAMAAMGATITATDIWQLTLPKDEPLYWVISGTLFLAGAVSYKYSGKIERMYKSIQSKCSRLFSSKPSPYSAPYLPDDIQ